MATTEQSYAFIWNGETSKCEECAETTDKLFERGDLQYVCEGCLNGMDEEDTKEEDDEHPAQS